VNLLQYGIFLLGVGVFLWGMSKMEQESTNKEKTFMDRVEHQSNQKPVIGRKRRQNTTKSDQKQRK